MTFPSIGRQVNGFTKGLGMGTLQVWEWVLLLIAVVVAVRSLARLMRIERDKLVAEITSEVEEQQRQKKEEERRQCAKKRGGAKKAA